MNNKNQGMVVIYQEADKPVEVRLDTGRDTVWLSLQQLAELFVRDKYLISRHIHNIYKEGELDRQATVAKNATVQIEGERQVRRRVEFYNLDAILSVGYRVNSRRAVQFRQWATRILREHLTRGWTLNQQRFEQNARELEAAMALVRKAAQSPELSTDSGRGGRQPACLPWSGKTVWPRCWATWTRRYSGNRPIQPWSPRRPTCFTLSSRTIHLRTVTSAARLSFLSTFSTKMAGC